MLDELESSLFDMIGPVEHEQDKMSWQLVENPDALAKLRRLVDWATHSIRPQLSTINLER